MDTFRCSHPSRILRWSCLDVKLKEENTTFCYEFPVSITLSFDQSHRQQFFLWETWSHVSTQSSNTHFLLHLTFCSTKTPDNVRMIIPGNCLSWFSVELSYSPGLSHAVCWYVYVVQGWEESKMYTRVARETTCFYACYVCCLVYYLVYSECIIIFTEERNKCPH